jgi:hypothetical protein
VMPKTASVCNSRSRNGLGKVLMRREVGRNYAGAEFSLAYKASA